MRLGVTFDLQTDPSDPRQAEFDPPRVIAALTEALRSLGHEVVELGGPRELLRAPERLRGLELVFNLAEGDRGRCREGWAPVLLELYGMPYTGSDALALMLGLDKVCCKQLAAASGVPTPRWIAVDRPQTLPRELGLRFPVIVKPRYQGSGIGIDEGAVVGDRQALAARVDWLWAQLQEPMLIEEFVDAGELTVCLIGNEPPEALPVVQRPIDPHSRLSTHVVCRDGAGWEAPLALTPALERHACRASQTMFETLGCRDVARVDFRVDRQGAVWFLEINPLPSFDPEGSFGLLAEALGVSYASLIGRVLQAARR